MSDNRLKSTDYNSLVASINYEYCKKYGYDFIYYRPYLDNEMVVLNNCLDPNSETPRHAAWSKLISTSKALELDYDYVAYIDSDCIFKDFNISLKDFIRNNINAKDILFFNNKPWGDDLPCSGFYICKVSLYTKQFIKDWYNYNIPERNTLHAWEQDALWKIFKEYNIQICNTQTFLIEENNQFLRHVSTFEKNNRLPYFKKFIETVGIDYPKNIKEIKTIEFTTRPYGHSDTIYSS